MKSLLFTALIIGSNTFASDQKSLMVELNTAIQGNGYEDPNPNSLVNAQSLFREFGAAVVCGQNDSALNLYIKRTVGNSAFKITSIASSDIKDIGRATCASINRP